MDTQATFGVFRLFVSSTFEDFWAERERLLGPVFERLRARCAQRGCRFEPVDLSWGVSEVASRSQETVAVCLEEVARCRALTARPNFLCLIGDRYGWRPLPTALSDTEYQSALDQSSAAQADLIAELYAEDDNSLDRPWRLLPFPPAWDGVERALRERQVRDALGKVLALPSATELEIDAGILADPEPIPGRAIGIVRRIEGLVEADSPPPPAAWPFLDTLDGRLDGDARRRLHSLHTRVAERLGDDLLSVTTRWQGSRPSESYFNRIAQVLEDRIWHVIKAEIDAHHRKPAIRVERALHWNEARCQADAMIGRGPEHATLERYLASTTPYPFVLYGRSGIGKTALVASAAERHRMRYPQDRIVYRFLGITPDSFSASSVMASLMTELHGFAGTSDLGAAADASGELTLLKTALADAARDTRVVVVLDGLDQLRGTGPAGPTWLPSTLPANVRLIVSVRGDDTPSALLERLPDATRLALGPMRIADAEAALDAWLTSARRRLRPTQRSAVMAAFHSDGTPLVLRLLFEEARRLHADEPVPSMPSTSHGLLEVLFRRLAEPARHGTTLVEAAMRSLAAARRGLGDDEMFALLSGDEDVVASYRERHPKSPRFDVLPPIAWARLRNDLRPYLQGRLTDGVLTWTFAHQRIESAVTARFAPTRSDRARAAHRSLAALFSGATRGAIRRDARALAERSFHQVRAGLVEEIGETLADSNYVVDMVEAIGPDRTHHEFAQLEASECTLAPTAARFTRLVEEALRLARAALRRDRAQAASQLGGRLIAHGLEGQFLTRATTAKTPTITPVSASLTQAGSASIGRLEGHEQAVTGLAALGPHKVASSSMDRTVRVWDLARATEHFPRPTVGNGPLSALAVGTTKYPLLIGDASVTGRVVLSDPRTPDRAGIEVACGGRGVADLAVGGSLAVAVLKNGAAVWLDLRVDAPSPMSLPLQSVQAVAADANDRVVLGFADGTLCWGTVHDLARAPRVAVSGGAALRCIALAPDGRHIAVGDGDGGVHLLTFDHSAPQAQRLGRHPDAVNAVEFTPDGAAVLTGHRDGSLNEWPLPCAKQGLPRRAGAPLRHRYAHENAVTAITLAQMREGQSIAITASDDTTIRLWNLGDEWSEHSIPVHRGAARCLVPVRHMRDFVLSGGEDGTVCATSSRGDSALGCWMHGDSAVTALATSADGQTFVTGHADGCACLWRMPSRIDAEAELLARTELNSRVHSAVLDAVTATAWLIGADATLIGWNLVQPHDAPSRLSLGHAGAVTCIAMTSDGLHVLSGSTDCELHLTRIDRAITRALPGKWGPIVTVAIERDRALCCDRDGQLGVWDLSRIDAPQLSCTMSLEKDIQAACVDHEFARFAAVNARGTVTVGSLRRGSAFSARLTLDARPSACAFTASNRAAVADASGQVHHLRVTGLS